MERLCPASPRVESLSGYYWSGRCDLELGLAIYSTSWREHQRSGINRLANCYWRQRWAKDRRVSCGWEHVTKHRHNGPTSTHTEAAWAVRTCRPRELRLLNYIINQSPRERAFGIHWPTVGLLWRVMLWLPPSVGKHGVVTRLVSTCFTSPRMVEKYCDRRVCLSVHSYI